MSTTQLLPGAGVTGLSTGVAPSNTVTGTIAAQPVPGLPYTLPSSQVTNQIIPPPTNQIAVSSLPQRALPTINSSLSSATGVTPLRPVSPVLSLTPLGPVGAMAPPPPPAAAGRLAPQQLTAVQQPLMAFGGVPASAPPLLQQALLSPPPARRVFIQSSPTSLLTPSLVTAPHHALQAPVMPLQQPYPQALAVQQPQVQPVMVHQPTQLVPYPPPPPPFLSHTPHPQLALGYQQPAGLVHMAPPPPQIIGVAPSNYGNYNPLLMPSQALAPPGAVYMAGTGLM